MRGFPCMSPQEIFDYKLGWKSYSFPVPFHSDWEMEYIDFCKENFNKWLGKKLYLVDLQVR